VSGASPASNPDRPGAPAPGRGRDLLLALLIAASRAPFLAAGYGTDTDAWKLAWAAREIGTTGHYAPSRLPGFPVQEYASALLWRGGPLALNGLSALASVIAALLFLRLWRRLGGRDAALATVAFAFVPAVFVGSVSAMDYLWAEAFVLGAVNLALDGRAAASGLLLGLATGCRITSAALGLPVALLLAGGLRRPRLAPLATLAGVAAGVAGLWYLPAFRRFGLGFLSYYEPQGTQKSVLEFLGGMVRLGPAPFSPALIAGQATVGVFGVLGTLGLAIAALAALLAAPGIRARGTAGAKGHPARHPPAPPPGHPPQPDPGPERSIVLPPGTLPGLVAGVLVTLALYLRLPHDEGYLIPAVPFVLLLLGAWTPRAVLRPCLAALILSPLVLGVDVVPPKKGSTPAHPSPLAYEFRVGRETVVVEPLRGPLLLDAAKRERSMAIARRTLAALGRLPDRAFLLAGVLHPVLFYFAPDDPRHPLYTDLLGAAALADSIQAGRRVYYLPDLPRRARRVAGYDLRAAGAEPLFPEEDDPATGPSAAGRDTVQALPGPPRR